MQNINDKFIINNFPFNKRIYWDRIDKNIIEYLNNRYNDSESKQESYYRIINNLENRPVCCVCGGKLKFNIRERHFPRHCSISCSRKNKESENKRKLTCLEKYGKYVNTEKFKNTCLEKYGVENVFQLKEIKEKISITHLINHNHPWWSNPEKTKETLRNKSNEDKNKSLTKRKLTCLEKYGVDNVAKNKTIYAKAMSTNLSKYNKENFTQTEEYINKSKITNNLRYGYDHHNQRKERRKILSEQFKSEEIQEKRLISLKLNSTIQSSRMEEEVFKKLKIKFINTIHSYRSENYPFICDFYIPELNLYIECNFSQYHNGKQYLGNENDLQEIENFKKRSNEIKEKTGKNKTQYDNIIYTWSDLDVRKRNIAKENNLNYLEFFNIKEFNKWFEAQ